MGQRYTQDDSIAADAVRSINVPSGQWGPHGRVRILRSEVCYFCTMFFGPVSSRVVAARSVVGLPYVPTHARAGHLKGCPTAVANPEAAQ